MTVKGNVISDTLQKLITYFAVIVVIGGWVTRVEVNQTDDRKDIDSINQTLIRVEKGQDAMLENEKEIQQTIVGGNKEISNQIVDLKLHQQEQDDKQDLLKQLK